VKITQYDYISRSEFTFRQGLSAKLTTVSNLEGVSFAGAWNALPHNSIWKSMATAQAGLDCGSWSIKFIKHPGPRVSEIENNEVGEEVYEQGM
jgi:hypothetical protein